MGWSIDAVRFRADGSIASGPKEPEDFWVGVVFDPYKIASIGYEAYPTRKGALEWAKEEKESWVTGKWKAPGASKRWHPFKMPPRLFDRVVYELRRT